MDKGYISKVQLIEAIKLQVKQNVLEGKHRLLGQIFVEEGFLMNAQVDEILEIMNQKICS